MVKLQIDGRQFQAKEGTTILEVARENDIPIPTLCYYEEVSPNGTCRLCVIELVSGKRRPLVPACSYAVEEGMKVLTRSKRVMRSRRMVIRLLLARAPHSERIQQLAKEIGAQPPPFRIKGNECILCGLCVRVCREMVGRGAITMITKGPSRAKLQACIQPWPERCIACGTCAYLCPTGHIKMFDFDNIRIIWDKVYKAKEHLISGRFYAPIDLVEYVKEAEGIKADFFFDQTTFYLEQRRKSES